ncbi:MAG: reductive dehalogenase domain-containing protein [Pseudomonadota bacterium]
MAVRLFSTKKRAPHLGPYPLERLTRLDDFQPSPAATPEPLSFHRPKEPHSIVNAMGEFQAMMDAIRDGFVNPNTADIPQDRVERANHMKSFGYFSDASMIGICEIPSTARLDNPVRNPDIERLGEALRTRQTKTLASGIDVIMADLKESIEAPPKDSSDHTHAIVFLYEHFRDPKPEEPGSDWILNAQAHRGCIRASETATIIANYIRLLGFAATAHSETTQDVNLLQLAEAAGLLWKDGGKHTAPWLGDKFSLAVVTTSLPMATDQPLAPKTDQPASALKGLKWTLGIGSQKSARTRDPYARRDYVQGAHPFENLKRVDTPTTYIDEPNVARVPKRADMFARAQFGDMGKNLQDNAKGGYYARKAAPSFAQRRLLGALVLLQDGKAADQKQKSTPERNAENLKAASYFLGIDAVGLSRCPDWTWYSHDATGDEIIPPHDQAVSMIVDQGFETMEGASGDDWISVAQSMRAYLRFSLLGGILAQQIRNLGYKAKAHTVMDGEVLQPPLLLLSGLGEVSRIGEVILNPYLGPRLKSGVVTTDMPMVHDRPIDFGLQNFCESCNKCARECPSGAITAGPKLMFNGYEIWKSDSQKCATYRITTKGGAMCGRCMKTCPWNLEGLFADAPFRWAAMKLPKAAPLLAKLDDMADRGSLNTLKKWWWDLELDEDGAYRAAKDPINARGLQKDLDLKYEDQTLAVYPAPLAPHPWPYPFPMDREAGIAAYKNLISAEEYQRRRAAGDTDMIHRFSISGDAPVIPARLSKVEKMTADVTKYEFETLDGAPLPDWQAGAHLDIVVAPEFLRQYSMSGDPANTQSYQIGVLREDEGRGGSALMHRIFNEGRRVFISKPINHFPLVEEAPMTYLMGGGIGITPMIAFAHRLHKLGRKFELHYSASSRDAAGYLDDLSNADWAENAHLHFSNEGTRADLKAILNYQTGAHVYTCGPDHYMQSVIDAARANNFPQDNCHLEYFSTPEQPDYKNHDFQIRLAQSGKDLVVPADKTISDILNENGFKIDVKCADGICGVCKCDYSEGEVEHRDFVLSNAQRETAIITCQSRAAQKDGTITLDL